MVPVITKKRLSRKRSQRVQDHSLLVLILLVLLIILSVFNIGIYLQSDGKFFSTVAKETSPQGGEVSLRIIAPPKDDSPKGETHG